MPEPSISINKSLFDILSKMKRNLTRQIDGEATYSLVIKILLREHYSIPHLEKQIDKLKNNLIQKDKDHKKELKKKDKDLKDKDEEIIKLLGDLLKARNNVPYIIPNGSISPPPPPPPPSKPISIKKIDLSKIKTAADVKKKFKEEMTQVFDGTIRKPSEIISAVKPDHLNAEIKEYDGDEINISEISYVIKNEKHFENKEQVAEYVE